MARVVAEVMPSYEDWVDWETVITKDLNGALRYAELCREAGRPIPVPSILIDGELVFDAIPSVEELKARLNGFLKVE
jgi:hypothetical protein